MVRILMIDALSGKIQAVRHDSLTLYQGGIIWVLWVPNPGLYSSGDEIMIPVYMHWNAESGPQLFGFGSESERQLFGFLISVSGVGPRLALAILRDLDLVVVVDAIVRGDSATLSTVSGLGRKKAENLIFSLKDKVEGLIASGAVEFSSASQTIAEVIKTLEALGYAKKEIQRALDLVVSSEDVSKKNTQELLKLVLKELVVAKR